ncbi:GAF domain-containing protein [Streptomyces sp. NPDC007095]|uniref:helix-turn-helix domain-containing protein n=1 Tax=Streptomyces sp. NPDC007095 TaxID=3154482 RepID=UPI000C704A17
MDSTTTHSRADAEPAARLLRLLREDAAQSEYDALLDRCPSEDRPRLALLVDDALQVRARLEERRRREAELAALYETAGDLSSLRDLEAVLQAIVRRARSLLGTDVAYLMLNDAQRGDTYMRVTDGIRTDAFKQARLAMGAGLGGLVAKTAVPYNTSDYFADLRFEHCIDDVVGGEGLISIEGVPLKLGENVIGVLFAANRRVRPFSEHEVALLVSLANHAAIAIENATLFQDVRRAVDELTEANGVIRAHSESIERAAALHERLTTIVLDGGGMADVAQTLAEVLGGSILVLDPRGRTMAAAGDDPLVEQARTEGALPDPCPAAHAVRDARVLSTDARRTRRIPAGADGSAACATPIVAGSELLGVLLLVRDHLDASGVRSLERAALVTALMLLSERTVAEAEHRLRGEILEDLLGSPHRDPEGLRRRATLVGLDLHRPHTVFAARCRDSAHRRRIADAAASYAAHARGLAGEYRGDTVVLLPQDPDPDEAARTLADHLSRVVDNLVTVGAATAAPGIDAIVEAHHDAARCLDVLLALDRDGEGASPGELGVYGLLFHQAGREELHRFVRRTIGPVLDYDTQRGGELTRTLLAFFACDTGLGRTAAELYIHVNTLYQRIDRITSLLGPQWRHGDQVLQVHLALKVHMVLSAA